MGSMFQLRRMTTFLMLSLTRARKISLSVPTMAMAIPRASSTRFPGSKRWRASIRRSNRKFFPTIPDDSTGFEAGQDVFNSELAECFDYGCAAVELVFHGRSPRIRICGAHHLTPECAGPLVLVILILIAGCSKRSRCGDA